MRDEQQQYAPTNHVDNENGKSGLAKFLYSICMLTKKANMVSTQVYGNAKWVRRRRRRRRGMRTMMDRKWFSREVVVTGG